MTKVCLSICYYKEILRDASSKCGTKVEFLPIREDVLRHLNDRHFADNSELVEIIKPLADLIDELEKAKTILADIIFQFLKLHLYFSRLAQRAFQKNPFVEESSKYCLYRLDKLVQTTHGKLQKSSPPCNFF